MSPLACLDFATCIGNTQIAWCWLPFAFPSEPTDLFLSERAVGVFQRADLPRGGAARRRFRARFNRGRTSGERVFFARGGAEISFVIDRYKGRTVAILS